VLRVALSGKAVSQYLVLKQAGMVTKVMAVALAPLRKRRLAAFLTTVVAVAEQGKTELGQV
jgi:hypothetical protein